MCLPNFEPSDLKVVTLRVAPSERATKRSGISRLLASAAPVYLQSNTVKSNEKYSQELRNMT